MSTAPLATKTVPAATAGANPAGLGVGTVACAPLAAALRRSCCPLSVAISRL
jgi:hypothetical protein